MAIILTIAKWQFKVTRRRLLSPPSQVWQVHVDSAFENLKNILSSSGRVDMPEPVLWNLLESNPVTGKIVAERIFQDGPISRKLVCTAEVVPDGDFSKVTFRYSESKSSGLEPIRLLVRETQQEFEAVSGCIAKA